MSKDMRKIGLDISERLKKMIYKHADIKPEDVSLRLDKLIQGCGLYPKRR